MYSAHQLALEFTANTFTDQVEAAEKNLNYPVREIRL